MKLLFSSIVFILFMAQTAHAQHSVSDLSGSWISDDGTTGNIQFLEGNKVQGSVNGVQFPPTSYTIDFGRTPIWFDVAITPGKIVQGLLEFIDDDTVRWQIILSGDRGYDFHESEGNPIIILKRKK